MSLRFGTVGAPQGTPQTGTTAAIEHIRHLGLDAFEIAWVRSVSARDESCLAMRQAAHDQDVVLSVHAPYFINLNSQTAEKMRASDARLLAAARKGYLAGARDIVFHPGSYHGQPPEQVYRRVREKLAELIATLHGEGVEVTLRPETMGKSAMFGTLEEVVRLSKEVQGVAPCIDVAHLHARTGDGRFNSYDEFAAMFRLVRDELGEEALHHMHFHISGIEYSPAGERNHLMLEESDLNWRAFLQACVDFGVEGVVVTESPTQEDDALLLKAAYEELTAHPAASK